MKYLKLGVLVLLALGCLTKHDFSEIESASQKQLELITRGLDQGLTIERSCAVRSWNYKGAYYVAALIQGPQKVDVGIWWISGDKEKPGMIQAVDGFAIVYSSFPKASKTRVGARTTDSEAKLLKAYLEEGKSDEVIEKESPH